MNSETLLALIFVPIVVGALLAAAIARSKGRSFVGWFLLGLLFAAPAIIGALLLQPDEQLTRRKFLLDGGRLCVECKSELARGATRCARCGAQQPVAVPLVDRMLPPPLPPHQAANAHSALSKLEALEKAVQAGVVSAEEFQLKKAQILSE